MKGWDKKQGRNPAGKQVLLLAAVGMQMFLSVYGVYSAGFMDPIYPALSALGNILNTGLFILFCIYLLFSVYIWDRRDCVIQKLREYLHVENLLLAAFLGWMYVSGFYHLAGNPEVLTDNAASYGNAILRVLLFFLLAQYLNGDRKKIHVLFNGLVILLTIFGIYVLAMLVFHSEFTLLGKGVVYFSGGVEKRLCINSNSNTTGMYAKTMLMLCVYMFVAVKRKYRWLYPAAAAVHYMILILSSSRAAIAAGGVGVAAVAMLAVWREFRSRKSYLRVLLSIGTFAAVLFLFLGLRTPAVGAYNVLREVCAGQEEIVLRRMGLRSSGRMALYKAAIRSMRDPEVALFGVTPTGVCELLNEITGQDLNMYTHNEFLEIMCAIGIPGLLLFLAWVFCIARKGWIICYDRENLFSMQEGALAVVCLAEIINNMLEAMLTFSVFLSGMIFYLAAGYILTDESKRRRREM